MKVLLFVVLFGIWGIAAVRLWVERRDLARSRQELERERRSFITDRSLLRALLAQSTDHIYFKDTAGRFLLVSTSLARAFGFENPDDLIGKSDFDFFGKTEVFEGEDVEKRIVRTGCPSAPYVRRKRWPDGQVRWKSTCKWPLLDECGRVWGTFGISRDVASPETAAVPSTPLNTARLLDDASQGVKHFSPPIVPQQNQTAPMQESGTRKQLPPVA